MSLCWKCGRAVNSCDAFGLSAIAGYGVKQKRVLIFPLAVAFFGMVGCSGLSRGAARAVIDHELKDTKVSLQVNLGRIGRECALDPTSDVRYFAAQKAGVITITPDGTDFWKIEPVGLKPVSRDNNDSASQGSASGCDYAPVALPLAQKSLVDVTGIHPLQDGTAEASFTWKWALTPRGEKIINQLSPSQLEDLDARLHSPYSELPALRFRVTDVSGSTNPHQGKKTLKKSADGWRVVFDQEMAAQVIADKLAFERQELFVDIGRVNSHCVTMVGKTEVETGENPDKDINTVTAAKAGYVSFAPEGKDYWRVNMTDKGMAVYVRDSKGNGMLERDTLKGCDFQKVSFIVAQPRLVQITRVTADEQSSEVEYVWKWVSTDLGLSLGERGETYSKLTAAQRRDLQSVLAVDEFAPALSLPVPSPEQAIATHSTMKLTRAQGYWH